MLLSRWILFRGTLDRVILAGVLLSGMFLAVPEALSATGGLGKTVSYQNLTGKAESKAFFADGGKKYVGKRIHIHVPARRIHASPTRSILQKGGVRYLFFKNETVPIVARAKDVYLRKARQRTSKTDTLCIKGVVKRDQSPGGAGYVILVSRIKKAPPRKP